MMAKKPSNGPARAQKTRRRRRAHVARNAFPIEMLSVAMEHTRVTPPSRVPVAQYGGPTVSVFTSQKIRALQDDSYAHFFKLEGKPETAFALLKEFAPSIRSYNPQPFTVEFLEHREVSRYTPDFAVFPFDEPAYAVEIKTAGFLTSRYGKAWADLRKNLFAEQGLELRFYTDEDLMSQPRHDTLLYLYHFLSYPEEGLIADFQELARALRSRGGAAELGQLPLPDQLKIVRGLAYGLSRGLLSSPFNVALCDEFLINLEH